MAQYRAGSSQRWTRMPFQLGAGYIRHPPARLADGLGVESLLVGPFWLSLTCAPEPRLGKLLAQLGPPLRDGFSVPDSAAKQLLSAADSAMQWRQEQMDVTPCHSCI